MTIFSGQTYLEKHRFCKQQLETPPKPGVSLIIVIPCHKESRLIDTLNSLENCDNPEIGVEVIVLVNASEKDSAEVLRVNDQCIADFHSWNDKPRKNAEYFILNFPDLPAKHAGVGLARKIGMDEAIGRFELTGIEDGLLVCLDADSTVHPNYLIEIHKHFQRYPKTEACSIYFEHPLFGTDYDEDVYRGITYYELFLRYYIEALRYAGHPYAFHTIGSSMAVRASAYQKQNGMNRRKAGEDFYFLMKFIVDGKLNELNSTCVYPSPRPADHVPFGTGKAILKWLEGERKNYMAYDPEIFEDLKIFLQQVPALYHQEPDSLPDSIQTYLDQEGFSKALHEIRKHVTSPLAFEKRFFKWFNGLRTLKYVHFAQAQYYPDVDIIEGARTLLEKNGLTDPVSSPQKLLEIYRNRQRGIVS